jgi:hypothetical protein
MAGLFFEVLVILPVGPSTAPGPAGVLELVDDEAVFQD